MSTGFLPWQDCAAAVDVDDDVDDVDDWAED
jgi:hypothetical protein